MGGDDTVSIWVPEEDTLFFPYNALFVIEAMTKSYIEGVDGVVHRRLNELDPDATVGLIPVNWTGVQDEIGRVENSTQLYTIFVQTLVVDMQEDRGLRTHSYFAKRMREMLARYHPLRVGLNGLETTDPNGVRESTSRFFVGEQVFHNAEADGNWQYLSTLELRLETQIG